MDEKKLAAILILVACVGCGHERTNSDYVRDNHCTSDGKVHAMPGEVIVVNGQEEFVGGEGNPYYTYTCPNGLDVFVDADQPHPNISKLEAKSE
jgi:hypothetical protein